MALIMALASLFWLRYPPASRSLSVPLNIQVVDGVSSDYQLATIRAPGVPFTSIRPEDFADGGAMFPLFTGTATVAELLDVRVFVICGRTTASTRRSRSTGTETYRSIGSLISPIP